MDNSTPHYTGFWKSNQRFIDAGRKNFRLISLAFLVGLITGGAGTLFRLLLIHLNLFSEGLFAGGGTSGFLRYLLPVLYSVSGIIISLFLVKKFAPEAAGSGIHEIEGALDNIRTLRWKRVLPVKFIASLFSLGSGLLLGREGPTIQLGANIGKMVKDIFRQPDDRTNPLASAGAAAGLASAFNAPLAGIIFVIEEMHGHFRHTFFSVAAIMVASGTADFVVRALIGVDPVIKMTIFPSPPLPSIWLFILLGFLFSILGLIFNKSLLFSLSFFDRFPKNSAYLFGGIAGVVIAVIGILSPKFIGGGYNTIRMVLDQSLTVQFLVVLIAGRLILTIFSYSTGVPGGIFAPILAIGVAFGMLFGGVMQNFFPDLVSNPGVFAVAGMAGIFASTVRAPLTGLVLAVEMTSNYEMILPLIMTTVIASSFTAQFGNEPIYTSLLVRSQAKVTGEKFQKAMGTDTQI